MTKNNRNDKDGILDLLRQLVALSYFKQGLSQKEIAKRIRVSKNKLNSYLKGIDKKNKK